MTNKQELSGRSIKNIYFSILDLGVDFSKNKFGIYESGNGFTATTMTYDRRHESFNVQLVDFIAKRYPVKIHRTLYDSEKLHQKVDEKDHLLRSEEEGLRTYPVPMPTICKIYTGRTDVDNCRKQVLLRKYNNIVVSGDELSHAIARDKFLFLYLLESSGGSCLLPWAMIDLNNNSEIEIGETVTKFIENGIDYLYIKPSSAALGEGAFPIKTTEAVKLICQLKNKTLDINSIADPLLKDALIYWLASHKGTMILQEMMRPQLHEQKASTIRVVYAAIVTNDGEVDFRLFDGFRKQPAEKINSTNKVPSIANTRSVPPTAVAFEKHYGELTREEIKKITEAVQPSLIQLHKITSNTNMQRVIIDLLNSNQASHFKLYALEHLSKYIYEPLNKEIKQIAYALLQNCLTPKNQYDYITNPAATTIKFVSNLLINHPLTQDSIVCDFFKQIVTSPLLNTGLVEEEKKLLLDTCKQLLQSIVGNDVSINCHNIVLNIYSNSTKSITLCAIANIFMQYAYSHLRDRKYTQSVEKYTQAIAYCKEAEGILNKVKNDNTSTSFLVPVTRAHTIAYRLYLETKQYLAGEPKDRNSFVKFGITQLEAIPTISDEMIAQHFSIAREVAMSYTDIVIEACNYVQKNMFICDVFPIYIYVLDKLQTFDTSLFSQNALKSMAVIERNFLFHAKNIYIKAIPELEYQFRQAIIKRDFIGIASCLDKGVNVNAVRLQSTQHPNPSKKTALHIACERQFVGMVKLLLLLNADISLKNREGQTPYDIAKEGRCEKIITLLEQHMADKNISINNSGEAAPLHGVSSC